MKQLNCLHDGSQKHDLLTPPEVTLPAASRRCPEVETKPGYARTRPRVEYFDAARSLQARRPLGGEIAEQQAKAEQQHQPGGAELDAAHDERAAAFTAA